MGGGGLSFNESKKGWFSLRIPVPWRVPLTRYTHRRFVRDVAVLLEAGLALLLLRGHVVRDVRVVALLCTPQITLVRMPFMTSYLCACA